MISVSKRSLWLLHGDWIGDRQGEREKCQGATAAFWARNGWRPGLGSGGGEGSHGSQPLPSEISPTTLSQK